MSTAVITAASCAAASLLVLARRRVRWRLREVLDVRAATYAARACELLRLQGFALLRLSPADARLAQQMLQDADACFQDAASTRRLHVPPMERRAVDSRSGYVCERGREFLELHPRAADSQALMSRSSESRVALMRSATAFAAASHDICERVLAEFARSCSAVAAVTAAEGDAEIGADGGGSGSGHRSGGSSYSAARHAVSVNLAVSASLALSP